MAEREKTLRIGCDALSDYSPAGSRFVEGYETLTRHADKRLMLLNALRIGQMFAEADLGALIAVFDNKKFAMASVEDKRNLICQALSLASTLDSGEPLAPVVVRAPVESIAKPENSQELPAQQVETPPATVVEKTDDGIKITEAAASIKPPKLGNLSASS